MSMIVPKNGRCHSGFGSPADTGPQTKYGPLTAGSGPKRDTMLSDHH